MEDVEEITTPPKVESALKLNFESDVMEDSTEDEHSDDTRDLNDVERLEEAITRIRSRQSRQIQAFRNTVRMLKSIADSTREAVDLLENDFNEMEDLYTELFDLTG